MIKVNLKSRKSAVGVSVGTDAGVAGGDIGGRLSAMFERAKTMDVSDAFASGGGDSKSMALQILVFAVVLGAAWWVGDDQKTRMLNELAVETAAVDSKIALLDSELNKTAGYEQIRKSLEADERSIRTKIATIQELIHERTTPPKILMTLSEAIPKNVWLRDFSLANSKFRISGSSDGMDAVSDFMKSLEETIYFKNIALKSSKQDPTPKAGRTSAQFDLEAERR